MTRVIDLIPGPLEEPLLGIALGFFGGWLLILGVTGLARSRPAFAYGVGLVTLGVIASLLLGAWYRPHSLGFGTRYEVESAATISLLTFTVVLSHRVVRQPGRIFRGLGHLGGCWSTLWLALLASQFLVYATLSDWQYGSRRSVFTLTMNSTILLAPVVFSCVWFVVAKRSADAAIRQRLSAHDNSAFIYDRSCWQPWLLAPLLVLSGPGVLLGSLGLLVAETAGEVVRTLSFLMSGILPLGAMLLGLRAKKHVHGHCNACGYSLRGLPDRKPIACPECGAINPV